MMIYYFILFLLCYSLIILVTNPWNNDKNPRIRNPTVCNRLGKAVNGDHSMNGTPQKSSCRGSTNNFR